MSPLLAFRRRHLLNQPEAARAVGIGLSTWTQIEAGFRGRPVPDRLLLHLAALDRLAQLGIAWPTPPPRIDHAEDEQV